MENNVPAFMTNEAAAAQGDNGTVGQGEPATPEEQAQYEKMVSNAMMTLHGEQSDAILQKISQGDPEQTIGEVVASIVIKLMESAEQSGKPLAESVLMAGGEEILNEVVNMAMVAGVLGDIDENEAEDIQQEAFFVALDKFGRYYQQTGRVDPNELESGMREAEAGKYDNESLEMG